MKYLTRALLLFITLGFVSATSNEKNEVVTDPTQVVKDVDPSLFQTANQTLSTVSCTLSDGTVTTCLKSGDLRHTHRPSDGPLVPDQHC